ncbi:peptidase, partial [Streptococcus pneumoniae]
MLDRWRDMRWLFRLIGAFFSFVWRFF